jgi:hypothetical protein
MMARRLHAQVPARSRFRREQLGCEWRGAWLAWRIKQTEGTIGFAEQREALEAVTGCGRPVVMGDRFYGSPELIAWCRGKGSGCDCGSSSICCAGGETTLAECFQRGRTS